MLSFYGESCTWRIHGRAAALLLALFPVFLFTTLARSQEHDMSSMPGMNMNATAAPENPAQAAKHLADKQESEFNHRLAGFFVIVAGIFIFSESYLDKRWSVVRYVWPVRSEERRVGKECILALT